MKYIVEQKKLESLMDSSVWELLSENNDSYDRVIICVGKYNELNNLISNFKTA